MKSILTQLIYSLVNLDTTTANKLFNEYLENKSRNILLNENYNLALQDFSQVADESDVKNSLDKFKAIQSRITNPQEKDINYWRKQGYDNFVQFINEIDNKDSKRKRIAKVKAASNEILTVKKTDNSHLFFPLSKEASCFYGGGTSWCISTRDGENYFYRYTIEAKHAVCFLIHDADVYALVFDPATGKIKECQDKNNKNDVSHDKFFEYAGVTQEELMAFTRENYNDIFAGLQHHHEKFDPKKLAEMVDTLLTSMMPQEDYTPSVGIIATQMIDIHTMSSSALKSIEGKIAQSAVASCCYAREIIKTRFTKGEAVIAKDPDLSVYYARNVILGRFYEGEAVIAKDLKAANSYAVNVIRGRWEEGEAIIAQNANAAYWYAKGAIQSRFIPGEVAIAGNSYVAAKYAALSPEHKAAMQKLGANV